jgi:D-glycero-D-manno-heptose 1,7-bisphosphate phosphatase
MSLRDLICQPWLYCSPSSRLTGSALGNFSGGAVFLDRDGTLVEDVGYLTDISQLQLRPGSLEGLRLLQDYFPIVMVTNQSAIARGLLDANGLQEIHRELVARLQRQGVILDAIYVCPHHPDGCVSPYQVECYCRKPQPGMLIQAMKDFQIQLSRSYMIGNKDNDVAAGQRAGVAATVLIASSSHEVKMTSDMAPTYTSENLHQAAHFIVNHAVNTHR